MAWTATKRFQGKAQEGTGNRQFSASDRGTEDGIGRQLCQGNPQPAPTEGPQGPHLNEHWTSSIIPVNHSHVTPPHRTSSDHNSHQPHNSWIKESDLITLDMEYFKALPQCTTWPVLAGSTSGTWEVQRFSWEKRGKDNAYQTNILVLLPVL